MRSSPSAPHPLSHSLVFTVDRKEHFDNKKQRQKEAREARKREREDKVKESKMGKKNDAFAPGLVLEVKGIPDGTERDVVKVRVLYQNRPLAFCRAPFRPC